MADTSRTGDERAEPSVGGDADATFEARDVSRLVAEVNGPLTSLLERTPLTTRQLQDFRQAVLEMAANAIKWGRGEDQKPWALITCRVGSEAVTAIVRDRGPGFDHALADRLALPQSWPLSDELIEEIAVRRRWGFGIMLTLGLVDVLSYNDQGNEVTLVKRFGPDTPG